MEKDINFLVRIKKCKMITEILAILQFCSSVEETRIFNTIKKLGFNMTKVCQWEWRDSLLLIIFQVCR